MSWINLKTLGERILEVTLIVPEIRTPRIGSGSIIKLIGVMQEVLISLPTISGTVLWNWLS